MPRADVFVHLVFFITAHKQQRVSLDRLLSVITVVALLSLQCEIRLTLFFI